MPIVSPVREYIRNRAMSAPLDQAGSGRKNKQPHKVAFLRTTRRWASPSQGPSAIRAKSLRLHASSDKENSSSTKSPMVKTPLGNGINGKKLLLSSGKRSMSARSAIRDGTPSSARRRRPSPLTRNKGTQTEQVQQRKSRSGSTTSSCSSPVAQEMPLAEAASFLHGALQKKEELRRAVIAKIQKLTVEIDNSDGASDDIEICDTPRAASPEIFPLKTPSAKELKRERAALQDEQLRLKGEIKSLCEQIASVEDQLQASQSHARCLSSSTIDWATIMSENTGAAVTNQKLQQLFEGVCVKKYGPKKGARNLFAIRHPPPCDG